jgi:hypothetical protein
VDRRIHFFALSPSIALWMFADYQNKKMSQFIISSELVWFRTSLRGLNSCDGNATHNPDNDKLSDCL